MGEEDGGGLISGVSCEILHIHRPGSLRGTVKKENNANDEERVGIWEYQDCSTSSEGHSVSVFMLSLFWSVPTVNT